MQSTPVPIRDVIWLGRLTAHQKPNGGVWGIVAGDIVRRLVAPHNVPTDDGEGASGHSSIPICMATKSGCECIAHALQGLTEMDPRATVMST